MKKIPIKPIKLTTDVSMNWELTRLSIKGPLGCSIIDTKKLDKKGLVVFKKTFTSPAPDPTVGSSQPCGLTSPKDPTSGALVRSSPAGAGLYSVESSQPCGLTPPKNPPLVPTVGPTSSQFCDTLSIYTIESPEKQLLKKNKKELALIKTIYSLIINEILGVSQGYLLHLDIVGIGYKVAINKQLLYFKLGYSHKIRYELPDNIRAFSTKANHLCLYSISWSTLKQTVAKIKALKKPEPYKGKGIRYRGEKISLKIGKKK